MSTTPNLAIPHILQSQAQKELTANDAFDRLDEAINDQATIDVSAGNTTVSVEDFNRNVLLVPTGSPSGTLDLTVPQSKRLFVVQNDCGQDVAVTTGAGTQIILTNGERRLLYGDGTNIVAVAPDFASVGGGGRGGGGGFPVFKGALLKRTTNFAIADATQTPLGWEGEVYDTGGFADLGAQATRLTVPAGKGITKAGGAQAASSLDVWMGCCCLVGTGAKACHRAGGLTPNRRTRHGQSPSRRHRFRRDVSVVCFGPMRAALKEPGADPRSRAGAEALRAALDCGIDFCGRFEEALDELCCERIAVVQWMWRTRPNEDPPRVALLPQIHDDVVACFEQLHDEGKVGHLWIFLYTAPAGRVALGTGSFGGLIGFFNPVEMEMAELFPALAERDMGFLAIRPLLEASSPTSGRTRRRSPRTTG